MKMKQILSMLLIAGLLGGPAKGGYLQDSDFASASYITGLGGSVSQLLNTSKIYDSVNGQLLDATIAGFTTPSAVLTTKGDLLTHNGTIEQRLLIGSDYQLLMASSSSASGIVWVTPSIGAIDGVAKSANGLVYSTSSLVAQHADASFPGLVSTGAQTMAGNKVFTGSVRSNSAFLLEDPGAGTNAITFLAPTLAGAYSLTWPVNNGTNGYFLQNDGSGVLSWATPGSASGFATTALDNLASVAINTALLPGADNTIDLGSASFNWNDAFLKGGAFFQETGAGTEFVSISAPSSLTASYALTLPTTDGNSGEFLQTNGVGVLTWATAGGGAGSNYLWSGYHDSDCAWAMPGAGAMTDLNIDATCGFTETFNVNFGTVSSYDDGTPGNNLPGLRFSPPVTGFYEVCINSGSLDNTAIYQIYDGVQVWNAAFHNTAGSVDTCFHYNATGTGPTNLRIQLGSGGGGMNINNNTNIRSTVEWNIHKL